MRAPIFFLLICAHIAIICVSNVLVQHPVVFFNWHTTWGAFSYPLIFILTDLTTRVMSASLARKIIYFAMFPGLISSFLISNWFEYDYLWVANTLAIRIAVASFCAYVLGQLLDIYFFQRLRQKRKWWVAPTVANILGNTLDTYSFFFIAFYQSKALFLRLHWVEIATVDLAFKLTISLLSFVPLYGLLLAWILRRQSTIDSTIVNNVV